MSKKQLLYRILMIGIAIVVIALVYIFLSKSRSPSEDLIYVASTTPPVVEVIKATTTPILTRYVEVVDGCNPYFVGECVNMREGPGKEYPVVVRLRTGVVLKVGELVTRNGASWYKVIFTHELIYPERVKDDWYVAAEFVQLITDESDHELKKGEVVATTTKHILVDVSEQTLYAYDGDQLFMKEPISTGLEFTPTPRGTFTVFKMTPSRFMQGPIPNVSDQVYDLPGVPWNLYFTQSGAVIHGAYWHDHFGKPWSHGCVNLSPQNAKKLYDWAEVGMKVIVRN